MPPSRSALEDLVHRVNNLLGTIETQCEVAQVIGTHDACKQALSMIQESARRTQAEVQAFRQGGQRPAP